MKCKKCNRGELLHLINITEESDNSIGIKKTGIVYICDNCEKNTLIKICNNKKDVSLGVDE